jgi:hypothetical protein
MFKVIGNKAVAKQNKELTRLNGMWASKKNMIADLDYISLITST